MKRHRDFELFVGKYLQENGFTNVVVTQGVADGGVDAFCEKNGIRYVIQDKMYGECKTKINRNQLFELCGAMHYNDCQGAIMIYNGGVVSDVYKVADKLGIQLIKLDQNLMDKPLSESDRTGSEITFDNVWCEIRNLIGKNISNSRGTSYWIDSVTDGDVTFTNQKGKKHRVPYEYFYKIADYISLYGSIKQTQIREKTNNSIYSAFIATVFANLPSFEVIDYNPTTIQLRRQLYNHKQ